MAALGPFQIAPPTLAPTDLQELETQRDYNQILLQSMPFSQPATCCLRGCPSLVGRSVSRSVSPEELQMNLMSVTRRENVERPGALSR